MSEPQSTQIDEKENHIITSMQLSLYFTTERDNPERIGQHIANNLRSRIVLSDDYYKQFENEPTIMPLPENAPYDTPYIFYSQAFTVLDQNKIPQQPPMGIFMELSKDALHFAYRWTHPIISGIFSKYAKDIIDLIDIDIARIGILGIAFNCTESADEQLLKNILGIEKINTIPEINGKNICNIAFRANSKAKFGIYDINNVISIWSENLHDTPRLCYSLDVNTAGIENRLTKEIQLSFIDDKLRLYAPSSLNEVFKK